MKQDLISVVVPVYNVERYLRACLDSLLAQTYSSLDILLVDDGSTDRSGAICDEYAHRDPRIRVVHQKNGGLSDARNTGISLATGRYITFVDSDDAVSADMLAYLYELIIREKADIATCQKQLIDENGKNIPSRAKSRSQTVHGNENCMKAFLVSKDIDTAAWGKLYKRELFREVRYPKGKYCEDIFTTYRLFALSNTITVGEERKYGYRVRSDSIMHRDFLPKHMDVIEGALLRADFVAAHYPKLLTDAQAGIISSVNLCVSKIIQSEQSMKDLKDVMARLQRYYRTYEKAYLKSRKRILTKLFTIAAYWNLTATVRLCRIFWRDPRRS